jgi:hypothetical protein
MGDGFVSRGCDDAVTGPREVRPQVAHEIFGQVESGVTGRSGIEAGDDGCERRAALNKRNAACEYCRFPAMLFPIVGCIHDNILSSPQKVLRDEMHRAVGNIPVFDFLIGIWEKPLSDRIDIDMGEAESPLNFDSDCRLTSARRATQNNQHAVIL